MSRSALWTVAGVTAVVGYLFRLDRGQQAARAAAPAQARDRRRDADVPLQHRHDDLEGARLTTTEGVLVAGLAA